MKNPITTTQVTPDGKLIAFKQFVNWRGYREVNGVGELLKGHIDKFVMPLQYDPFKQRIDVPDELFTFTIND